MLSEFKPPHSIWNKGSNSVDLLVTWKTSIQELDNHVADNTPNQNIPLRRMSQRSRRFTESLQKYFRWVWRRWQCRCMGYDVRESTPKISIFLTIFEVTETNPSCPAAKRTMRVYKKMNGVQHYPATTAVILYACLPADSDLSPATFDNEQPVRASFTPCLSECSQTLP